MITAPAFWVFAAIIVAGGLWGLWITLERLFSRCCGFGGSSSPSGRKPVPASNSTTTTTQPILGQPQVPKGKQRQVLLGGEEEEEEVEDGRHVRWQPYNQVIGGGDRVDVYDEERNVGMMEMQARQGGPIDRGRGGMR